MRVLLFAMPDTISALDPILKIPNLGLCSIAGNLDGCTTAVVDLAFRNRRLERRIEAILARFDPDLVGLSAMSFQYDSARRVARLCRRLKPDTRIVLGGYHASLLYEEIGAGPDAGLFDFLVRGEGELTMRSLVRELGGGRSHGGRRAAADTEVGGGRSHAEAGGFCQAEPCRTGVLLGGSAGGRRAAEAMDGVGGRGDWAGIPGLSWRDGGSYRHNPAAPPADLDALALPDRGCRLFDGACFLGLPFDCVETSRGCTMGCRFCSITRVYGHSVRHFPLERVLEDLRRVQARGARGVFFVDDNITLDVPRLKELCRLIIRERLNGMAYLMQASVTGIAADPELAPLLGQAGFRWVFLGIESGIARNLKGLGKGGTPDGSRRAVAALQGQGICVFGGFIVGHPDDTWKDIEATYRYALEIGVDHPIMQCLTPYPKTETREELLAGGLVTNPRDYSRYNGFTCNVRTRHLSERELSRAMLWSGLKLYFHPRYLARSRFWRFHPTLWPDLAANNFRYLGGAARGRIFASLHTW